MNMKNLSLNLILACLVSFSYGQDANFSQVFNAPMIMNPAQTGNLDMDWRLTGGYRSTAFSGMRSFATGMASMERRIAGSLTGSDRFGAGAFALFDESNGGALKSNLFGLSAAYNNRLDEYGKHSVGLGIQGVWTSSTLFANRLVFEDQFASGGFIPSLPSYDAFRGGNYSYFDLNAGIHYEFNTERYSLTAGYSISHINRPVQQFWGKDYRIEVKNSVQLLGRIALGNVSDDIHLLALYNWQGKFNETLLGGYYSTSNSNETFRFNAGAFYRMNSSLIPMIGFEYNRFKGTATYDVNVNQSQAGSVSRRALELFVSYQFGKKNK